MILALALALALPPECNDSAKITTPWDTIAAQALRAREPKRALNAEEAELKSLRKCVPADPAWYNYLIAMTQIQEIDPLTDLHQDPRPQIFTALQSLQRLAADPKIVNRIAVVYPQIIELLRLYNIDVPPSLQTFSTT